MGGNPSGGGNSKEGKGLKVLVLKAKKGTRRGLISVVLKALDWIKLL